MTTNQRPQFTVIQGGTTSAEAEMQAFLLDYSAALQPAVNASVLSPESTGVVDPSLSATLYRTSLESMSRTFLSLVAENRFELESDNEFIAFMGRKAIEGMLEPAWEFEHRFMKPKEGERPRTKDQTKRHHDIVQGMGASLLLWDTLANATVKPRITKQPPEDLSAQLIDTTDAYAIDYARTPESRILTATYAVEIQPDIARGIKAFTAMIQVDANHLNWGINNFVKDFDGRPSTIPGMNQIVDPNAFQAGALLVASHIRVGSHLQLVTG